jgi:acyl-CoA dehydrogenase
MEMWIVAALVFFLGLGFFGAPLWLWTAGIAGVFWQLGVSNPVWIAFGVVAAIFNIFPIRQLLISSPIMALINKLGIFPVISETEMTALKAGGVWVEGELFSGKPNFKTLLTQNYPKLTAEERAFLDGPCDEVCKMCDDYKIWNDKDLTPEIWEFLKKKGFLGMIIPKEFGGLGFSAFAHSEVVMKLATRSVPLSITVMVPNSLGPAELLVHYGTAEQKKYYLPRLASGEDVPCFALTEPNAGSDAGAIQSNGVVFKGTDGKLYLRLNWNKRWITLAAVSTVIGLAFRLYDPENLLGKGKKDLGITCALIPHKTPGVVANRRHDPLGVPFFNCPTQGIDVVVPVDAIIGGANEAGHGWHMLMESLAAGRGISLPAQATAGGKYIARVAGAHAMVRRQFGTSIGNFEGITEPLARIGGYTYLLDAARVYTLGGLDAGIKPPVVTAILKYYFTELQRKIVNDGMDIVGGQAISQGPRNLLAHAYHSIPISITVEGANILTRTLIIFGQGALRAHPYAYKEVDSAGRGDTKGFDRAFWGHMGHVLRNGVRTVLLGLTRGWLVLPAKWGVTAKYYRRLAWTSATFAFMADFSMGTLGGKLKTKGKTTGRYADILGHMYIATACLKRFEMEGRRKEDVPYLRWALDHCFAQIQIAFDGIFASIEVPVLGWFFRNPVRWITSMNAIGRVPSDQLDIAVAHLIQQPGEQRDRMTAGIFLPKEEHEQLARLEVALKLSVESDAINRKVRSAVKKKQLPKQPPQELFKSALEKKIITQQEYDVLARAETQRNQVIQVDDFDLKEYKEGLHSSPTSSGSGGLAGSIRTAK